jgi:hypothetical protein
MMLTNPCYIPCSTHSWLLPLLFLYFDICTFFCCTDTTSQNLDVANHNDVVDVSSILSEIPVNRITTSQPTTGEFYPHDICNARASHMTLCMCFPHDVMHVLPT